MKDFVDLNEKLEPTSKIEPCEYAFTVDGAQYEFNCGVFFKKICNIGEGGSFGELALLKQMRRTASLRTTEDACFAILNKGSFERCLAEVLMQQRNKYLDFLAKLPILEVYSRQMIQDIIDDSEVLTFVPFEKLFKCGEPAKFVYLVMKGEFEQVFNHHPGAEFQLDGDCEQLRSRSLNRQKNLMVMSQATPITSKVLELSRKQQKDRRKTFMSKAKQLGFFGPGSVLGIEDVFGSNENYCSSVVCKSEKGRVLKVPKKVFRTLKANPAGWSVFEGQIAKRNFQICNTVIKSFEQIKKAEKKKTQVRLSETDSVSAILAAFGVQNYVFLDNCTTFENIKTFVEENLAKSQPQKQPLVKEDNEMSKFLVKEDQISPKSNMRSISVSFIDPKLHSPLIERMKNLSPINVRSISNCSGHSILPVSKKNQMSQARNIVVNRLKNKEGQPEIYKKCLLALDKASRGLSQSRSKSVQRRRNTKASTDHYLSASVVIPLKDFNLSVDTLFQGTSSAVNRAFDPTQIQPSCQAYHADQRALSAFSPLRQRKSLLNSFAAQQTSQERPWNANYISKASTKEHLFKKISTNQLRDLSKLDKDRTKSALQGRFSKNINEEFSKYGEGVRRELKISKPTKRDRSNSMFYFSQEHKRALNVDKRAIFFMKPDSQPKKDELVDRIVNQKIKTSDSFWDSKFKQKLGQLTVQSPQGQFHLEKFEGALQYAEKQLRNSSDTKELKTQKVLESAKDKILKEARRKLVQQYRARKLKK